MAADARIRVMARRARSWLNVFGLLALSTLSLAPTNAVAQSSVGAAPSAAAGDWTKLPEKLQKLREVYRQAFGFDADAPNPQSCTEKKCFFAGRSGEQRPGARVNGADVSIDSELTGRWFDEWPDSKIYTPPWRPVAWPEDSPGGRPKDKETAEREKRLLNLGPAWKGAVGAGSLGFGGGHFQFMYQHNAYPMGEGAGDLLCKQFAVRVSQRFYDTVINNRYGPEFERRVGELSQFARDDLEPKLLAFAQAAGASGVCDPPGGGGDAPGGSGRK